MRVKYMREACAVCLLMAGMAVAQTPAVAPAPVVSTSGQLGGTGTAGPIGFQGGARFNRVTDAPFSGEQITERVQTLADGTHITQTTGTTMMYRDSAGRTRAEHMFTMQGVASGSGPKFVEILDPVAGYRYTFNEQNHTAQRMAWPPGMNRTGQTNAASVTASTGTAGSVSSRAITVNPNQANPNQTGTATARRQRPEVSRESLGTQIIDGIPAEGMRITVTYAIGTFGNDRPITTVSENWTSPELHIQVLSKVSDPRNGDTTTKLTNVSQVEPDPALFQVPADYSIEEQQQAVVW